MISGGRGAAAVTRATALRVTRAEQALLGDSPAVGAPASAPGMPSRSTSVVDVADRELDEALAQSFLAQLPVDLIERLREDGERVDYPAGAVVYQAGSPPRAALVVRGLMRVFLSSPGGRQVTVRYARPGNVLA